MVDGGLSLQPRLRGQSSVDADQRWAKAQVILQSFAEEADAIALGSDDWASAPSTGVLRDLLVAQKVPVLAANLSCGGSAPFPPSRVVERGGRTLGIVGVTQGTVDGCVVDPPGPALAEAVASLPPVDAVVALVPLPSSAAVAQVVGDAPVHVVVDGSGRYSASGPEAMGTAWAIGTGTRGKHLGVAELVFVPGGEGFVPLVDPAQGKQQVERLERRLASVDERLAALDEAPDGPRSKSLRAQQVRLQGELSAARRQLSPPDGETRHQLRLDEVELSDDVADDADVLARVEAVGRRISSRLVASASQRLVEAPSDYAGADACVGCHEGPAAQWSSTPHARAYATLASDGSAADASCIPCHVTGFADDAVDFRPYAPVHGAGGPAEPAAVGGYRDVQCEACHGPARAHVAAPDDPAKRPLAAPGVEVCRQCHDNERDDHDFDLSTYLPKVVHQAKKD